MVNVEAGFKPRPLRLVQGWTSEQAGKPKETLGVSLRQTGNEISPFIGTAEDNRWPGGAGG